MPGYLTGVFLSFLQNMVLNDLLVTSLNKAGKKGILYFLSKAIKARV
jgi:hypothetical protein